MEEYKKFLEAVRASTGIDALVPDDFGLVSVSVDERYTVNLQYVEASRKVLCFIEVATVDIETPKSVYRDLLAGGLFGRETAGGYFALEPETGTVVYNYMFDLDVVSANIDDFVATLEKMLALCDMWANRIKNSSSESTDQEDAESDVPPDAPHNRIIV